jgi:ABC-type nitrate/sulfonate/bicarbonate transport system substrate-binding protein
MADARITYNALTKGSVDAAVFTVAETVRAREAGLRQLLSFSDDSLGLVQPQGNLILRQSLLHSDPVTVEKFVRATLKGLLYARANRAEAISIFSRLNRMTEEMGKKVFDLFYPAMTADGTISEEEQTKTIEQFTERAGRGGRSAVGEGIRLFIFA